MAFHYRYIIIIPIGSTAVGNTAAAAWDFDAGGAETFNKARRLSANGEEPATHLLVNTVANDAMHSAIQTASGTVSGVVLYDATDTGGYTSASAAAAEGLQIIEAVIL